METSVSEYETFSKKGLWHRHFPESIGKFLRKAVLTEHLQ